MNNEHCRNEFERANGGAIPQLFERLFLISWENNGDCHITMPLSLKTMEVQCRLKGISEIMYVCM